MREHPERSPRLSRVAVVGLALVLAGCDPLEPDAGVGVSLGEAGQVRIHVALCPGEMLSRLELLKTEDNVVGSEDDLVL
jgi:hypothetical protein